MTNTNCTRSSSPRQANSLHFVTQSIFTGNPITIESAESMDTEHLSPLINVEGQQVHAPVLTEDGLLIVDTGRTILDLEPEEVDVLRAVILSLDVALAA